MKLQSIKILPNLQGTGQRRIRYTFFNTIAIYKSYNF